MFAAILSAEGLFWKLQKMYNKRPVVALKLKHKIKPNKMVTKRKV